MRLVSLIILGAVFGPPALGSDGQALAFVPASRDTRSFEGFELLDPPSEGVVKLVGADRVVAEQHAETHRVSSIEISIPRDGDADTAPLDGSAVPGIVAKAHWPDAHGRITVGPIENGSMPAIPEIRNPWEVRVRAKVDGKDIVFDCGGIVIGGEGGAVAILNGRIVRRGDSLGEFRIAGVIPSGVALERNGSYIMIPKGRPTTVAIVGR